MGHQRFVATFLLVVGLLLLAMRSVSAAGTPAETAKPAADRASDRGREPLPRTNAEWKARLTGQQYYVLRRRGTERPFTGKYWHVKTPGVYRCAGCDQPLFGSDAKYDSGTGWPSYWRPYAADSIKTRPDHGFFTERTEVLCSCCEGHLGHVFSDGPPPTGLRYCINSAALRLDESTAATSASTSAAPP